MSEENQNAKKELGKALERKEFKITVDDTAMKQMAEANAELKQEKKELEAKLERVEGQDIELKGDFDKKDLGDKEIELFKEYGDRRILEAKTDSDLRDVMTDIVKTGLQNAKGSPSGSAPLNSQQMGIQQNDSELDLLKRQFSSPEELIMALRKEKSARSEEILNQLWRKTIEATKSGQKMVYPPEDEIKSEQGKVADRNFLTPDTVHENEPSELEKLGIQKNPLWYAQKNKEEFERMKKEAKEKRRA